jgi:hypothetical protein
MAFKKKLHTCTPDRPPATIETERSTTVRRREPCDPRRLERGVREVLARKVSGNRVGLWLLVGEHLRLGTWDLLCGWTGRPGEEVEPRLALQLVHEAALCVSGVRQRRCLTQKGFELLNGLPFVASDPAVHDLLDAHTMAEAQRLQLALGALRRASGQFRGRRLAIDPHRVRSYTQRQMRQRQAGPHHRPFKMAQTFFCLDADTSQPVCFTTATAARSVSQATPELLRLAAAIVQPVPGQALVLADTEHFTADLIDHVHADSPFDLLVPAPAQRHLQRRMQAVPPDQFTPHWAGYATAEIPYQPVHGRTGPVRLLIQRTAERPPEYRYNGFVATGQHDDVELLTRDYPDRWHIEEFFNAYQAMAWSRAGTMNLHIRYGQMTLALVAQGVIEPLRQRLGPPAATWDAPHLAKDLFGGLEGDLRVRGDTIVVTYYNAPHVERLREHFEHLPARLEREGIDPRVPWLYGLKVDFRFR